MAKPNITITTAANGSTWLRATRLRHSTSRSRRAISRAESNQLTVSPDTSTVPPTMSTTREASGIGAVGLVAGNEHGDAGRRGLTDDRVEVVATGGVEAGVRLVEQPQLGAADHEAGERGAPLLAGGQPPHRDIGQTTGQTETFERRHPLVLGCPDRRSPEGDVLRHGEVEVQPVAVAEHADERPEPVSLGGQVAAEHGAPPTSEWHEARAESQQRGLAGAVRARAATRSRRGRRPA